MLANRAKIKRKIRLEIETKSIFQVLIEAIQKHLLKMSSVNVCCITRKDLNKDPKYYFLKSQPSLIHYGD